MGKLYQYIPFQLSIVVILGILVGHQFLCINTTVVIVCLMLFLSLMLIAFRLKRAKKLFQFSTYGFVFFAIWFRLLSIQPTWSNEHLQPREVYADSILKIMTVRQQLRPSKYYNRYIAEVKQVADTLVKGRVLIYQSEVSKCNVLSIGDCCYTYQSFLPINKPINNFDYANYMALRGVYHQLKLSDSNFVK